MNRLGAVYMMTVYLVLGMGAAASAQTSEPFLFGTTLRSIPNAHHPWARETHLVPPDRAFPAHALVHESFAGEGEGNFEFSSSQSVL